MWSHAGVQGKIICHFLILREQNIFVALGSDSPSCPKVFAHMHGIKPFSILITFYYNTYFQTWI